MASNLIDQLLDVWVWWHGDERVFSHGLFARFHWRDEAGLFLHDFPLLLGVAQVLIVVCLKLRNFFVRGRPRRSLHNFGYVLGWDRPGLAHRHEVLRLQNGDDVLLLGAYVFERIAFLHQSGYFSLVLIDGILRLLYNFLLLF